MPSNITTSELKTQIANGRPPQIIDVRSSSEFATGHVPGAVNIPLEQVESRLPDLSPHPIVLVCQSGKRAAVAAGLLATHHPDIHVLEGGTSAWVKRGFPTVACVSTRWALERQVRFGAGVLVLTGAVLSITVHPAWLYLSAFVGAGLTFAGLTNFCPMAVFLSKMPWNRAGTNGPATATNCRVCE